MLTVSNQLSTNLVIPEGLGDKGALTLTPKGKAAVEKLTASLKEAEKRGLIVIAYPQARKKSKAKTENKTETKAEQPETH